MAWLLVTQETPSGAEMAEAGRLAEGACRSAVRADADVLQAVARACYIAGHPRPAAHMARLALARTRKDQPLLAALTAELEDYERPAVEALLQERMGPRGGRP